MFMYTYIFSCFTTTSEVYTHVAPIAHRRDKYYLCKRNTRRLPNCAIHTNESGEWKITTGISIRIFLFYLKSPRLNERQ